MIDDCAEGNVLPGGGSTPYLFFQIIYYCNIVYDSICQNSTVPVIIVTHTFLQ